MTLNWAKAQLKPKPKLGFNWVPTKWAVAVQKFTNNPAPKNI